MADPAQAGDPCGDCQVCDGEGACVTCDAAAQTCCGTACADLQTDANHCGNCATACPGEQVCQGGVCGFRCGNAFCPAASEICDDGACQPCHVCADGCEFSTVQGAIDGAPPNTIRICAGTYTSAGGGAPVALIAGSNLTLIGAGSGSGGTILDGSGVVSPLAVIHCDDTTSDILHLTVTKAPSGGGINGSDTSSLILSDVTVSENTNLFPGGGISNQGFMLLTAGTSVIGNTASLGGLGGGVFNSGTLELRDGATVTGNTAAGNLTSIGGGIGNTGGSVTLFDGASVTENKATTGLAAVAGGISNSNGGTVTLKPGSSVTDNTANTGAGGILNDAGTVNAEAGSDLSGNEGPPGTSSNCIDANGGTGCPD